MKRTHNKEHKSSSLLSISILLLISVIPLFALFHPGLPITHDGKDHVARIANFYANLSEGTIIPRWGANLNWGYGHPVLMFLYPLPSYAASLFHFLGFSFVDSVKLVFGVAFIASGLAMYLWLQAFLPRIAAVIGGLLYLFAPYRFVDLYVRGAIGEHVAFIFPPLVLYFLLKLAHESSITNHGKKKNTKGKSILHNSYFIIQDVQYWYLLGGSLSMAGLILAHNAISLMFLPVILLYAFFLIQQSTHKKRLFLTSLFVILFGFLIAAFFWLPALLEGKYTLRDIVTEGLIANRFSSFDQFVYGSWHFGGTGYLSKQVGIIQWLGVLASIPVLYTLYRKKEKQFILIAGFFILFWMTLFLMTSVSTFVWEKITLLQKFQFPWRFLSLTVFATAFLGSFVFSRIPQQKQFLVGSITIGALLLLTSPYWNANGYLQKPESFYTGIYESTTDTGESSPIWSERFMERYPKAHVEIIGGTGTIHETSRSAREHSYKVDAKTPVDVRENTLYFPGWIALVDDKEVPLQFQDNNNRGVITFLVPEGEHDVILRFTETKLRILANAVSGVSLLILFGLGILSLVSARRTK